MRTIRKWLTCPAAPKVFTALAVLLAVNVLIAVMMISHAQKTFLDQLRFRLLDVCNSAAALIKGEDVAALTEEDIGSERYDRVLGTLRIFQNSIDLSYIYAVDAGKDGVFRYTIDPDPESPAGFGAEIGTTPALLSAASGVPAMDTEINSDEWGTFYSAFSPIYDTRGNIVGIVGADYEVSALRPYLTRSYLLIAAVTGTSMLSGILLGLHILRLSAVMSDNIE